MPFLIESCAIYGNDDWGENKLITERYRGKVTKKICGLLLVVFQTDAEAQQSTLTSDQQFIIHNSNHTTGGGLPLLFYRAFFLVQVSMLLNMGCSFHSYNPNIQMWSTVSIKHGVADRIWYDFASSQMILKRGHKIKYSKKRKVNFFFLISWHNWFYLNTTHFSIFIKY